MDDQLSGGALRDAIKRLIYQDESGNQNIPNYRFDPTHTAQGYGQITNSTWRDIAPSAGIDLSQYPNAMSAPFDVQDHAVDALLDKRGTDPWAPYNPKLRQDIAKLTNGNDMSYPPFGNARAMSALMPDDGTSGSSVPSTTLDPVLAQAQALSAGGGGSAIDPAAAYSKLLNTGMGYNPSKLLASMAAGFLGGKGPAQSLAGGFGGMAASQKDDSATLGELAKYSMLYGPVFQQKILQSKQQAATALASRGKTPLGQAFQTFGLPPAEGKTYADMDKEWMQTQPLPAGAQKQVEGAVTDIGNLSNLQQRYDMAANQLKNGEFHVDAGHQAAYAAVLADPTGLAAKMAPQTAEEALKYNAFTQLRSQAQQVVQNAQKGALSDFRSSEAGKAIMGGYGGMNDKAAEQHFRQLSNATAMDINNNRNRISTAYKTSGRIMPDDFWESNNLPKTPLGTVPVQQIYENPYKDNNPGAAPAPAAGPTATGPNGQKLILQNGAWVPLQTGQ